MTIEGTAFVLDQEDFTSNETDTFTIFEAGTVDVFMRDVPIRVELPCVGDEVRVELRFDLHLKESDNTSVEVKRVNHAGQRVHVWLYEGTDCDTDDLDAWGWWHPAGDPDGDPVVPADAEVFFQEIHVENGEFNSPDYVEVELTVRNEQQTFPQSASASSKGARHSVPTSEAILDSSTRNDPRP